MPGGVRPLDEIECGARATPPDSTPNALSYDLYRGITKGVWPAPIVTGLSATAAALVATGV